MNYSILQFGHANALEQWYLILGRKSFIPNLEWKHTNREELSKDWQSGRRRRQPKSRMWLDHSCQNFYWTGITVESLSESTVADIIHVP